MRPTNKKDLEHSGTEPESVDEVVDQLADRLHSTKAEMLTDPEFLAGMLRQAVAGSSFPTEGMGGVQEKERKHSLAGRTKRIKLYVFLSETEFDQLTSYKKQRGDRSTSDLINEMLCRALAALRIL